MFNKSELDIKNKEFQEKLSSCLDKEDDWEVNVKNSSVITHKENKISLIQTGGEVVLPKIKGDDITIKLNGKNRRKAYRIYKKHAEKKVINNLDIASKILNGTYVIVMVSKDYYGDYLNKFGGQGMAEKYINYINNNTIGTYEIDFNYIGYIFKSHSEASYFKLTFL